VQDEQERCAWFPSSNGKDDATAITKVTSPPNFGSPLRAYVQFSSPLIIVASNAAYFNELLGGDRSATSTRSSAGMETQILERVLSYKLQVKEAEVYGKAKYVNAKGNTECAEFVRQATGAPQSIAWKRGTWVKEAKFGTIERGTAIATFDSDKKYPTDELGKHAAIYLEHDTRRILVLDQWNDQGEVKPRPIGFNRPKGTRRSNDGDTFYVIE
jgi:hypothetical protein